jgi:hypothetical protein
MCVGEPSRVRGWVMRGFYGPTLIFNEHWGGGGEGRGQGRKVGVAHTIVLSHTAHTVFDFSARN